MRGLRWSSHAVRRARRRRVGRDVRVGEGGRLGPARADPVHDDVDLRRGQETASALRERRHGGSRNTVGGHATIRRVTADGVPGTAMPAFAQSAGGLLTAAQIDVIVNGIRARWAKPTALADANVPPYAAPTGAAHSVGAPS